MAATGVTVLIIVARDTSLGFSCQQNDVKKKMRIKDNVVSSRVVTKRRCVARMIQLTKNQAACTIAIMLKRD